jgi:choline dehydrogenase-like flavoprotein
MLDDYAHMAGLWVVGEDLPQSGNRISLSDDAVDQWGLPAAHVHFDDHANDIAMRNHGYAQGKALYEAVGARRVHFTPPFPSTHNLGSCRMSADPEKGVLNRFGQTHDVPNLFVSDGSQFTSGAAVNPTLTIVALAIRQAEHIAGQLSARAL